MKTNGKEPVCGYLRPWLRDILPLELSLWRF